MTGHKMTPKLTQYANLFKDARERNANEADTVLLLIKMFEDILNYDPLHGEISKEVSIRDRYCDFCVKIDGEIEYIVEAKSASHKTLKDKDIEQAENYASRGGINWVLLTNGFDWQLYHLLFAEQEGIAHDLVFNFNLVMKLFSLKKKCYLPPP
jgi:predicted type IV restriction endonuclease